MTSTCNRIKRATQYLAVMLIVGVWLASGCLASDVVTGVRNTGSGNANIRPINSPSIEGLELYIADISPKDYFDALGSLNGMDGNSVVIDDTQHPLASNVSVSGIAKWSKVGLKLNSSGEVVEIEVLPDEPH